MAQDRSRSGHGGNFRGPNPNRDRKREPATIDGEVVPGSAGAAAEPVAATNPPPTGAPSPAEPAAETSGTAASGTKSATSDASGEKTILDPGPGAPAEPAPEAKKPSPAVPPVKATGAPGAAKSGEDPAVSRPASKSSDSGPTPPPPPRESVFSASPTEPSVARDEPTAPPAASRSLLPALGALAALLLSGAALYTAMTAGRSGVSPADLSSLAQRLDRTEARLSGSDQKLAALDARPAAAPVDLAPLSARIDAAEKLAREAQAGAGRALQRPEPTPTPRVDLAPLEKRIAALETRPTPVFDSAPLDRRIAGLEGEIAPLKKVLETPKTEVRATEEPVVGTPPGDAAAVAVVAQSLREKLDRGTPFKPELAALEKLGADAQRLAPLKSLADKGAPGAQALLQSFRSVASATAQAGQQTGQPGDPPAGFLDRLTRNAANLVRIRPVGEAQGDDSGALVSRIESALARGDVRQAVAQWDALPPAAQQSSRDWADRARTRAEADASVRQILDEAIERLGRTQ